MKVWSIGGVLLKRSHAAPQGSTTPDFTLFSLFFPPFSKFFIIIFILVFFFFSPPWRNSFSSSCSERVFYTPDWQHLMYGHIWSHRTTPALITSLFPKRFPLNIYELTREPPSSTSISSPRGSTFGKAGGQSSRYHPWTAPGWPRLDLPSLIVFAADGAQELRLYLGQGTECGGRELWGLSPLNCPSLASGQREDFCGWRIVASAVREELGQGKVLF